MRIGPRLPMTFVLPPFPTSNFQTSGSLPPCFATRAASGKGQTLVQPSLFYLSRRRALHLNSSALSENVQACALTGASSTNVFGDDGTVEQTISSFTHATCDESVSGVYATVNDTGHVTYIGMSRDIAASLELHASTHPDDVHAVRVHTVRPPSPQRMARIAAEWLSKLEYTPIGNSEHWFEVDQELHSFSNHTSTTISMDESDLDSSASVPQTKRSKRIKQKPDNEPRISPFVSHNANDVDVVQNSGPRPRLTFENVDEVLNELRPYLISDGGNISVVDVDEVAGIVRLRLEGACVSCESSATTMHLGVEKSLRGKFGNQIVSIAVVDEPGWSDVISFQKCQQALNSIQSVVRAFGASVRLVEVDEDEVVLKYSGPANMKSAVERVLREKVPGIVAVTFE